MAASIILICRSQIEALETKINQLLDARGFSIQAPASSGSSSCDTRVAKTSPVLFMASHLRASSAAETPCMESDSGVEHASTTFQTRSAKDVIDAGLLISHKKISDNCNSSFSLRDHSVPYNSRRTASRETFPIPSHSRSGRTWRLATPEDPWAGGEEGYQSMLSGTTTRRSTNV